MVNLLFLHRFFRELPTRPLCGVGPRRWTPSLLRWATGWHRSKLTRMASGRHSCRQQKKVSQISECHEMWQSAGEPESWLETCTCHKRQQGHFSQVLYIRTLAYCKVASCFFSNAFNDFAITGGPYVVKATSTKAQTDITMENVMFGDVYLCG